MTAPGPPFVLAWEALPSQWAGATRRLLRGLMLRLFALACAISVLTLGLMWAGGMRPVPALLAWGAVWPALIALGAREYVILRSRIRWWRHPEQYGTGPTTLHADAEGLSMTSSTSALSSRWETFQGVLRTRRLLILRVGRGVGLAIPRSAFADAATEGAFVDHVRAWCAAAERSEDTTPVPAPSEGAAPRDDPEAVHVHWDHAVEDSLAFVRWARWDRNRNRLLVTIGGALLLLTSAAGSMLLLRTGDGPVELFPFSMLGVLAIVLGTLPLWGRRLSEWRLRRHLANDPRGHPLGPHTLHAGPTGLYTEMPRATASLAWSQVTGVVSVKDRTFLMLGPWHAWVVPDRAFGSPEAAESFRARAEAWRARAAAHPHASRPRPSRDNPFEAPGES